MTTKTAIFLSCVLLFLLMVQSIALAQRFRYGGEFGLWVEEEGGQLTVHWLTAEKDSGLLEVIQDGKKLARFETPFSNKHNARLGIPNEQQVSLRYGSLAQSQDQHQTQIDFKPARPEARIKDVDTLFVVGDIHGEFDNVIALLESSGLINADLHWSGGKKHLVALGDIFDRGHDVIRTLWFLYGLEREASQNGGAVHVILGNHEIMAMGYDIRYLSGKERAIADLYGVPYSEMFHPQKSILGRWLASRLAVMKIGSILLAHGGMAPARKNERIEAINDSLFTFIHEPVFLHLLDDSLSLTMIDTLSYYRRLQFFHGEESTFWYRGYAAFDTLEQGLKGVLRAEKASLQVIAHTPFNTITELYGGQIFDVDLVKPASEMLLLVRKKKNKYLAQKVDMAGRLSPVLPPPVREPRLKEE